MDKPKYLAWPLLFGFLLFQIASCTSYPGPQKYKVLKNVQYGQEGKSELIGEVYIPQQEKKAPGVLLVHGGGWRSGSYKDMRSIAHSLAGHGFVVFNINYHLNKSFRHPSPIKDLSFALDHFKENAKKYNLQKDNIGLWGYSSGGHTVTYFALTNAGTENAVQAVVAGGTPFDFTWYPKSPYIKSYMGFYRDAGLEAYYEASPAYKVTEKAPPFFLYHAKKDDLVEHAQSTAFEARLKRHNIPVTRHDIGFWGHTTAFIFSTKAVVKGIEFLEEVLK